MQLEAALWEAINRYAIAVGGDPSAHVYGNSQRMQAVADVGTIVARVASRQQIDDIVIEDLGNSSNAAAAAACKRGTEIERLRSVLGASRDFLRGVARRPELGPGAQEVLDEVAMIDRALVDGVT